MTTMTHHSSNQVTGLRQLVLFPELLGVTSVPLDQGKQERGCLEEPEERQLSLKDRPPAEQMSLW